MTGGINKRKPSLNIISTDKLKENESEINLNKSCDIEETTIRRGSLSINGEGIQMTEDDEKVNQPETIFNSEDFQIVGIIGKGSSGHVRKVRHDKSKKFYAIKVLSNVYDKVKRDQLLTEILTLQSIKCLRDNSISVILEYCDLGSLDRIIKKKGKIPEDVLASICYQILIGFIYLRQEKRFHRDVKPQNILLQTTGQVKLTDFGISKELHNSMELASTFVGTFLYMSPERIKNEPYSYKSDIWSLGLVLIECATGKYPYTDIKSHIELVQSILDSPSPVVSSTEFSHDFRNFLGECLDKNPAKRLSADILIESPWLIKNNATSSQKCIFKVRDWIAGFDESLIV